MQDGEKGSQHNEDQCAYPLRMKEQDAYPSRECQNGRNAKGTECRRSRRCERNDDLGDCTHRRPAETIHCHHEHCEHDGSQAVEPAAHERRRAQDGVGHGEREQDGKAGQHVTKSRQQTPPPTATRMSKKDAELCRRSPRHHVDQRKALDEALLGEPLPLFLELRLHDSPHRGSAVRRDTQLQETRGNLLPIPCKCSTGRACHVCLLLSHSATGVLRSNGPTFSGRAGARPSCDLRGPRRPPGPLQRLVISPLVRARRCSPLGRKPQAQDRAASAPPVMLPLVLPRCTRRRCDLNRGTPPRSRRCRSFSSASSHRTRAWRRRDRDRLSLWS